MKSIILKNFKFGLDTRRDVLTSQPGTLVQLVNGHINQGAEIEGRKAFVKVGSIPLGAAAPTFDLLAVNDPSLNSNLITFTSVSFTRTTTFRSRNNNIATITLTGTPAVPYRVGDTIDVVGLGGTGYQALNTPITAVTGTTISYASVGPNESTTADSGGTVLLLLFSGLVEPVQLTQPISAIATGSLGDTMSAAMTGVTASCAFNNTWWVSATFGSATGTNIKTNGGTYAFVGTSAVMSNYIGLVDFEGVTNNTEQLQALVVELQTEIPAFLGSTFSSSFVGLHAGEVSITGPVNAPFTETATFTSGSSGTFIIETTRAIASSPGKTAVGATTTFYLVSGTSGSINTLVDSNSVQLITSAVNYITSLYNTAVLLANAINNRTGTTGYSAVVSLASTNIAQVTITNALTVGGTGNSITATINTTTIKIDTTVDGAGAAGNSTLTFAGGVTGIGPTSQTDFYSFGGTWVYGDVWGTTVIYNDVQYTLGQGNITGLVPTFAMALGSKVNFVAGTTWAFSKVGDATRWENQDTGAGTIVISDQNFSPSPLVALAPFQGKMAVFANQNVQIWNIASLPSQYVQAQVFQNTGAVAALSVQALGELDVFFLASSGIRSLRIIETTLNAFLSDVGSPIDQLITTSLANGTAQSNAAACGVIDPTVNRYWLYLNGVIYVLSYFPSLKISAWSTYQPTYLLNGVQTVFTPIKFVSFNNQVYVLASDGSIYLYGGTNNSTYDGCPVTVELPWLDDDAPQIEKRLESLAYAATGQWDYQYATDILSGTLHDAGTFGNPTSPNVTTDSSFPYSGKIGISGVSTHLKLKATSTTANTGRVTLGCLAIRYEEAAMR